MKWFDKNNENERIEEPIADFECPQTDFRDPCGNYITCNLSIILFKYIIRIVRIFVVQIRPFVVIMGPIHKIFETLKPVSTPGIFAKKYFFSILSYN